MKKLKICFKDYNDYPVDTVQNLIKETLIDKAEYIKFFLAVNEAVGNAIRYKKEPSNEQMVYMNIYVMPKEYLMFKIVSNTEAGDSKKLLNKLHALKDKEAWTDAFKKKLGGGGYWIILEGVSEVYIDKDIHTVYLIKNFNDTDMDKTPKKLINKLHLLQESETWDGDISE